MPKTTEISAEMSAVLLLKTSVFCAISAVFQQFFYAFSAVLLCYFSSFTMISSSFIMHFQQFYYAFLAPDLFLFLLIFKYS